MSHLVFPEFEPLFSEENGTVILNDSGGLNENDPNELIYLNTWYPGGGTVWEGLEGVDLVRGDASLRVDFEV